MYSNFHKISSLLMALLVLLSTFSFAVESHYCGDELVESSFFGHVVSCGMEKQESSFTSDECSIDSKNCCHNEKILLSGQDDLIVLDIELSTQQQLFVASFIYVYIFNGVDKKVTSYEAYSPPILIKNLQLLDEVFLI